MMINLNNHDNHDNHNNHNNDNNDDNNNRPRALPGCGALGLPRDAVHGLPGRLLLVRVPVAEFFHCP